ncbi:MAG: cryptochrome/photolyase family protein [Pseudomonadales bacterium]
MTTPGNRVLLLFGNQLFDPELLRARWAGSAPRELIVVMVEDEAFCRRFSYHRQKLTLVLAAMRSQADGLRAAGFRVHYRTLEEGATWRSALDDLQRQMGFDTLCHFEVESPGLTTALAGYAQRRGLKLQVQRTPMFLDSLRDFAAHLDDHGAPQLSVFYRQQRLRHRILLTSAGEPVGGRWSLDQENRAKLPKDLKPLEPALPTETRHVREVKALVAERFVDHPGALDSFWLPTTHQQARDWFDGFLESRFRHFGRFEDALTRRSAFVYHSALAPLLNVGLLTPDVVLDRALDYAARNDVPLNSLEGFVRQILGWREFVRGVFHHYYQPLQTRNIWNGDRKLTQAWYTGNTGIGPMDHVIRKTLRLGWAHHTERLMLAANLMNLAGVHPQQVYGWFMEMFVDAYDWVMAPNVFGMGLTSEGGIFTTKPYICGSNYVMKMGDFKRGEWCDVMDGLLWRFVAHHEQTLKANQRLAPMVANLPRVARRRPEIFSLAEEFIETNTRAA